MAWCGNLFTLLIKPVIYFFNQPSLLRHVRDILPRTFNNNLLKFEPEYADDSDRLGSILRESKKYATVFISIEAKVWNQDHNKITDIGLSTWYTGSFDPGRYSHYWQVKDNLSLRNECTANEPDTFMFGSTGLVEEGADIALILDAMFKSLISQPQRVAIVGHDVHSTIGLLKTYWEPPGSIMILDTQRIWQVQYGRVDKVTLEDALDMTLGAVYNKCWLHNAGNDARFILNLLEAQGGLILRAQNDVGLDFEHVLR
ncbi:hypothetical protein F4813DRAFT_299906 [Daldinia decipiens]|uniref:uncharacterized protein n=1 Tax=Daldinia decipiens TaxID=326647 RepID=UPI0020C566D7|nr:uncharacterized protein F4813DRAFT_299906 [Daldinia decipiens]KAI1660637.1 hypothetical protein F4813DRAFT_299906 [Daldinia decipiens]